MEFQKSLVLLDDFIFTENDVWGNRHNPLFDWMNLTRAKNKGHTIVMHVFHDILLRSYIIFLRYCFLKCFYIETINNYESKKYFMDKMNYVSRCELVYSKKSDILPNNY